MVNQNENLYPFPERRIVRSHEGLPKGGGGDNYDGMEARIARLEASAAHLERDVGEMRVDMKDARERLTRVEVKIDHLPTKGWAFKATLAFLTAVAALIAFQGHIQQIIGLQ